MKLNKLISSLAIMFFAVTARAADPNVSVYVDHASYTSARIFEFDIMMKATGSTSAFELRTFQSSLYLNPAWFNSGALTIENVSTYSQMGGVGYNGSFQWDNTDKLINCSVNFDVLGPTTCISTTVTTAPLVVTRIRLTNTVDFTCSTPDIKFNYVSNISPLRLRTTFSWREVGCTTNYEMFYPGRPYTGVAIFNGETYASNDADSKSTVSPVSNPGFCFAQLEISAIIQGFYIGGGQMQPTLYNSYVEHATPEQTDSVTIELHDSADPSITIASTKTVLSTSGTGYCLFDLSLAGTSYWIVFKHRNSIETWSNAPVLLTSRTTFSFIQ